MPVDPNMNVTFVLLAASNSRPSSSKAEVRSEAAATVSSSLAVVVTEDRSLHALTHASANKNAASGVSRVSSRKIIRRVKVYLGASHLVSFQNTERRRINMNSDEVLTTDFGISELMNIRHFSACDGACRAFTTRVVTQTLLLVELEDRFPHQALLNSYHTMRTGVIVNWRLLARTPADHQHLNCVVATNSMAPVIAFFEAEVWLQIEVGNLDVLDPAIQVCEGWNAGLTL